MILSQNILLDKRLAIPPGVYFDHTDSTPANIHTCWGSCFVSLMECVNVAWKQLGQAVRDPNH
jgi:hypothetical protein